MLVWLLHYQSCILCFITFFTKHGVANASNELVPKWQNSFYFWNQFRILVYSNLQKSPPCKLKSPPKSGKSQNRPLTHNIAPGGRFRPRWISLVYMFLMPLLLKQASDPAGCQNLQAGVPTSFQNFTRWFHLNKTSSNVSVQQICTCSQCMFLICRKQATYGKLASLKYLFNCHMIWKIITTEKHIEIQECLCSAKLPLEPGDFCDMWGRMSRSS